MRAKKATPWPRHATWAAETVTRSTGMVSATTFNTASGFLDPERDGGQRRREGHLVIAGAVGCKIDLPSPVTWQCGYLGLRVGEASHPGPAEDSENAPTQMDASGDNGAGQDPQPLEWDNRAPFLPPLYFRCCGGEGRNGCDYPLSCDQRLREGHDEHDYFRRCHQRLREGKCTGNGTCEKGGSRWLGILGYAALWRFSNLVLVKPDVITYSAATSAYDQRLRKGHDRNVYSQHFNQRLREKSGAANGSCERGGYGG